MARTTVLISSHFPYLTVKVTVKQRVFDVEALLDTGFDGEIILPPGLATNGELPYWYVDCKLANESVVKISAFKCSLKLANKKINEVTALIMGDEPVIGREIIKHFKITLDHGRKIILER